MKKFKGIELPVNSVIVIALAIFVLLMLAMFLGKGAAQLTAIEAQNAYQSGCSQLSSMYSCDPKKVDQVSTGLVIEGGAVDFLTACRTNFNNPLMSADACVKGCPGCQGTGITVTAGKTCSDKSECDSVYTKNWECNIGHDVSGKYCCPSGQKYCAAEYACKDASASCGSASAVADGTECTTDASACGASSNCVADYDTGDANKYCCRDSTKKWSVTDSVCK
jgi:hypothetical protein